MTTSQAHMTIYESDPDEAIQRLARLDGSRCPDGRVLVAAVDGEPRAAVPLEGGRAIADPFQPTAELVTLLELRIDQMNSPSNRGRLARVAAGLHHRRRAPARPVPAARPLQ